MIYVCWNAPFIAECLTVSLHEINWLLSKSNSIKREKITEERKQEVGQIMAEGAAQGEWCQK